jgi:hypothetical protein
MSDWPGFIEILEARQQRNFMEGFGALRCLGRRESPTRCQWSRSGKEGRVFQAARPIDKKTNDCSD